MKRKKRRSTNCVCCAKPSGEMKLTDSILLHKIVKEGLEQMYKEKSVGRIYSLGMQRERLEDESHRRVGHRHMAD